MLDELMEDGGWKQSTMDFVAVRNGMKERGIAASEKDISTHAKPLAGWK